MKTVIISAWSRPLRNGKENAKNYPFWTEVVTLLRKNGVKTVQVCIAGEKRIGADVRYEGMKLKQLESLVLSSDGWVSVDNFFPHLCASVSKKGVVIFGKSDPKIFGHKINTNLLKNEDNLRLDQFRWWEDVPHDSSVFVDPDTVCLAIFNLWQS